RDHLVLVNRGVAPSGDAPQQDGCQFRQWADEDPSDYLELRKSKFLQRRIDDPTRRATLDRQQVADDLGADLTGLDAVGGEFGIGGLQDAARPRTASDADQQEVRVLKLVQIRLARDLG